MFFLLHLSTNQNTCLSPCLIQFLWRNSAFEADLTFFPTHTLHLICECRTRAFARYLHLERVSLGLRRHGATNHKPRFTVVTHRGQDKSWPVALLFVTSLRIKLQPDKYPLRPGYRNCASEQFLAHWRPEINRPMHILGRNGRHHFIQVQT